MTSPHYVAQLAQKYQDEFQRNAIETGDTITITAREAVSTVQQKVDSIAPTAIGFKDYFISVVTDFKETKIHSNDILNIMLWSSILVLGSKITSTLSHFLLHPFIHLVFDGSTALYLSAIFIPVYVHFKQSREPLSEEKSRFRLLAYAGIQGLIVGYIQQDSFLLFSDPFAFLGLAVMGLSALFLHPVLGESRLNYLVAVTGSGFAVHFVIGLLFGQLGFIYLLMALLYTAAAFILLQYYLNPAETKAMPHLYMYYNFIAVMYIQLVFYYVFGYTKEDYKKLSVVAEKP
uniref:Protein YIPF3 n=1 Tax=Strongyloides papillosus TaxID=174720 RepID=A0A0N5BHH9_STREA